MAFQKSYRSYKTGAKHGFTNGFQYAVKKVYYTLMKADNTAALETLREEYETAIDTTMTVRIDTDDSSDTV